jgi:aminoglycoside phosphotransferase
VSQDSGRYWGLNSLQARESYKAGPYEYKLASYIRYIAMKMEAETTEESFVAPETIHGLAIETYGWIH